MFAERTASRTQAAPLARVGARAVEIWERLALAAILILSAILELWRLGADGYPNTYYAAGVRSMLENWHNFFFNSFDPAGFVTIDKPPLGFWIQTLSAWIFGFHPWSVLLPEAIAGVLSVALLYYLVARVFGEPAGLLAALALTVMPINAVTDRNNVVDGLLVFTVLLAAWAVTRAVETGKTRWLILGAVLVGLGFNIKMLEAYLVVPALGLMYLVGAHVSWPRRILQLALTAVVLAVVSASWITAVDLTPAGNRPYVGSTTTNSEWDLAIGYNGLQRLNGRGSGQFGGGPGRFGPGGGQLGRGSGQFGRGSGQAGRGSGQAGGGFAPGGAPPAGAPPFTGGEAPTRANLGGFTRGENGAPGITRLFNQQIGTQVSWLLPLAILGLIVAAVATRPRFPLDARQSALVLWGMWGLTQAIFFSKAEFFHVYYMVMMTPAICALFGIGVVTLWQRYRAGGWQAWLLPLGLALTALVQIAMIRNTPTTLDHLGIVIGIASGLIALLLIAVRFIRGAGVRLWPVLAGAAGLVMLIGPGMWTQQAIASGNGGVMPGAQPPGRFGPPSNRAAGAFARRGGGAQDQSQVDPKLIAYLNAHQDHRKYYVAGLQSFTVAPIIIATGKPAIALGGFSGSDPIVNVKAVQRMIRTGQIRYFLLPSFRAGIPARALSFLPKQVRSRIEEGGGFRGGFGGLGREGNNTVSRWVTARCTAVPPAQWRSASVSSGPGFGFGFRGRGDAGGESLYDCVPAS